MEKNSARPMALGLTVLGGLLRIVQMMNFAPVGAMSLFAGARLRGWRAYAIPLALMAVTDPIVGAIYHRGVGYSFATPFVYVSFLITVWIGTRLRRTENPLWIGTAAAAGSVQFFLITNFAVWLSSTQTYPHTLAGLVSCYVAGIPFYGRTLASDLLYSAVFFGLHAWLSRTVARQERVALAVG